MRVTRRYLCVTHLSGIRAPWPGDRVQGSSSMTQIVKAGSAPGLVIFHHRSFLCTCFHGVAIRDTVFLVRGYIFLDLVVEQTMYIPNR